MAELELTTISQKGQVVIPQGIRKEIDAKPGTKFVVYLKDGSVVFKKLKMPTREEFLRMLENGKKHAKEKGISLRDVLEDD
jgi:AbrB family looped-hinge helix DNA binding protein